MALNFTLQTETVSFPGGDITVRGLSFPDLAQIIDVNRDALVPLFDKYSGRKPEKLIGEDVGSIVIDVIAAAPTAVTHIIALAADASDQFNQIAQIPIGAQIEILSKVGELTFKTSGGLGNLAKVVEKLVRSAATETNNLRASTNGFGGSGVR
jgi:hypothetical protein